MNLQNGDDLSEGKAEYKIPVENLVDAPNSEEKVYPKHFVYMSGNVEIKGFKQTNLNGCKCVGVCLPDTCECINRSTIRLTDDNRIDLRNGRPNFHDQILYECSSKTCKGCLGKCQWRLTPEKFNLQVTLFKTEQAGWAVRSRQCIEAGTYIAEFVGEVVNEKTMENRPTDYAYNLPLHFKNVNKSSNIFVDPKVYGNITRFFNHSCFENLHPFRFFSQHRDKSRISLGFYASRDILPGDELTIDYGFDWWKEKIENVKNGEPFYCCCDWIYCLNPAPGKPQLDEKYVWQEMQKRIARNHEILMQHKENTEKHKRIMGKKKESDLEDQSTSNEDSDY